MSTSLASINYPLPSISLTAQSAGVPQVVYVGQNLTDGWVKVWNEAPFQLLATSGSGSPLHEVSAQAIDTFQLPPGVKMFTLTPLGIIPFAAPSYQVRMAVFPYGPPPGSYPQALGRQAAPTGAPAGAGFSAQFQFSNTSFAAINIFNGSTTKIFTPYEGDVEGSIAAGTVATLSFNTSGANNNLGTGAAAQPNNPAGPSSVATVTTENSLLGGDLTISGRRSLATGSVAMIPFPDQKQVAPGGNLMLSYNGAAGSNGTLSFKWLEQ